MTRSIVLTLVPLLTGCSLLDGIPEKTVVDTLCITVKKKGWSANDSPKTIRDVRAWNRQIDRHCGAADKVAIR